MVVVVVVPGLTSDGEDDDVDVPPPTASALIMFLDINIVPALVVTGGRLILVEGGNGSDDE